jgi:hypothetical protein
MMRNQELSLSVDHPPGRDQTQQPHSPTAALALIQDVLARIEQPRKTNVPASAELLAALAELRTLRTEIAAWEPQLVTAAREAGTSWASLAGALGVASRQAAERRYLRLRPSHGGERTGEDRVKAERSKRAAERATNQWAKQNSASLRQLAGQVSGLADLSPKGKRLVEQVRDALGTNNAAGLLSPLADAREYLQAHDNTSLADRIGQVTADVERVRHGAHRNRRSDAGGGPEDLAATDD